MISIDTQVLLCYHGSNPVNVINFMVEKTVSSVYKDDSTNQVIHLVLGLFYSWLSHSIDPFTGYYYKKEKEYKRSNK